MREIGIIIRHTIRMLLRNIGFWVLLIIMPILCALILNIKVAEDTEIALDKFQVYELEKLSESTNYSIDMYRFPIKICDSTGDGLGMQIAQEIAGVGLFQVFYYDTTECTEEEIAKEVERCSQNERIGGILILRESLEAEIRNGSLKEGIIYYDSERDERGELLKDSMAQILGNYIQLAAMTEAEDSLVQAVESYHDSMPSMKEEVIELEAAGEELAYNEKWEVQNIGYMFAVVTISFLFTGVLIADTVIKERRDKVLDRMFLTGVTPVQYSLAKYIVAVITVLIQTGITALSLALICKQEYAVTNVQLMFCIAILGIIFNTMSLCIGILCNNAMNTNYIAFSIWSISCLLSGCYFDLSDAGQGIKGISNLMPQKWALSSVKMFVLNQSGGYVILLTVMIAFLVVIGTLGVIGAVRSSRD